MDGEDRPRGRLSRRLAWAVVLVGVAVFAVFVPIRAGHTDQVFWLDVGVYGAVYIAVGLLLIIQRAPDPRARWGWRILGLAMFLYCTGNVYFSLIAARGPELLYPSLADYFYLSWYPLAFAAVPMIIRPGLTRTDVGLALDALIAGLGGAAVVLALTLGDVVVVQGASTQEIIVNLAYPAADLLLVVLLVASIWTVGRRLTTAELALAAGIALEATADVIYLVQDAGDSYVEGSWVDLLWLLGLVAIAAAHELGNRQIHQVARWARTAGGPGRDAGGGPGRDAGRGPGGVIGRFPWSGITLPVGSSLVCMILIGLHQMGHVPPAAMIPADAAVLAALFRASLSVREVRNAKRREVAILHEQARTDELTGLPNRRALYEHCERMVATAAADRPVSLLLLDLDRFKEINDALGHSAGDQLLSEVSERVRKALTPSDLLARLGGDEFAIIVRGPVATARERAETVLQAVAEPFTITGTRLHVEMSIGIACSPEHAVSRSELLRFADVAMYDAKRNRARIGVYASEPGADGRDRLRTVEELRGAMAGEDPRRNGFLLVHLQPQLALGQPGEVVGAEALVRWSHPLHGLLLPGAFLPLARSAGIFDGLVDVVLDLALGACRRWWQQGWKVPVSVNVSTSDLHDPVIVSRVGAALRRYGLPGEALVVEVTEETLMIDPTGALTVLASLRELGAQVSIDDFGSGYSSFAYLRSLPADELKLDILFTQDLARDPTETSRPAAIVRTIADLAHSLGLRLIAEGIEDGQVALLLNRLGVDVGQGFYLARPMPLERLLPWLQDLRGPVRESTVVIRRRGERPVGG
ncbi:MAG: hypothetical protein QG622_1281 [Actinomycetota bacterium]|nr:hypothetical protein [Actinomycetota bacterium]